MSSEQDNTAKIHFKHNGLMDNSIPRISRDIKGLLGYLRKWWLWIVFRLIIVLGIVYCCQKLLSQYIAISGFSNETNFVGESLAIIGFFVLVAIMFQYILYLKKICGELMYQREDAKKEMNMYRLELKEHHDETKSIGRQRVLLEVMENIRMLGNNIEFVSNNEDNKSNGNATEKWAVPSRNTMVRANLSRLIEISIEPLCDLARMENNLISRFAQDVIYSNRSMLYHKDFSGLSLAEIDIHGANLEGAIFKGTSLRSAKLSGADMKNASLWGADLWGADLSGANLWGADLRLVDLWGSDLIGANLWEADFRLADLRLANLTDANLTGADLTNADMRGVNLRNAYMEDVRLTDADLQGADLRGVKKLSIEQLMQAKTLYQTKLDRTVESGIQMEKGALLLKPVS